MYYWELFGLVWRFIVGGVGMLGIWDTQAYEFRWSLPINFSLKLRIEKSPESVTTTIQKTGRFLPKKITQPIANMQTLPQQRKLPIIKIRTHKKFLRNLRKNMLRMLPQELIYPGSIRRMWEMQTWRTSQSFIKMVWIE